MVTDVRQEGIVIGDYNIDAVNYYLMNPSSI